MRSGVTRTQVRLDESEVTQAATQLPTACPRCGTGLVRVRRRGRDRLLSSVVLSRRYVCRNADCRWTQTVFAGPSSTAHRATRWVVLLLVTLLVATLTSALVVRHLSEQRPGAESE